VLVLCVFAVALTVAANPPKPPSAEEIAAAVRQLGDGPVRHPRAGDPGGCGLRGADAESALRDALKSRDPEVARRARETARTRSNGASSPTTPDEVVALVEKYRAGDAAAQNEAVRGLVQGAGGPASPSWPELDIESRPRHNLPWPRR